MRAAVALFLAALSFAAVVVAQRDQGVVRDEVVYMASGTRYAHWWIDFVTGRDGMATETTITSHFGGSRATDNNREHPPLMKTLSGLSEMLFHRVLGWADKITAYRIPSAAMNALLIALVFLFASATWGRAVGLFAALFTLFLPRAFFHAGLACFDASVVTTWFAVLYAYVRALDSRPWCVGLAVAYGLALATKHNALMLPAVVAAHYVWIAARSHWPDLKRSPLKGRIRVLGRGLVSIQPLLFPAMLVLGPVILIILWPWLWFDTVDHVVEWVRFHLGHVHYNYEYLGENWNAAPYPWHVPLVTTLFTVPVVTLFSACFGLAALLRAWRTRRGDDRDPTPPADRAPAMLLFLSAAVAMGPFLLGSVPIFGAEKHWAPAIPTVCIAAGIGLVSAVECAVRGTAQRLGERWPAGLARWLGLVAVGGAALGAAAAETIAAHPYALSHYNTLAGGAPGGADLGMNRQFWGYAARGVLPYLNRHAPGPGAPPRPVYSHDASPAWGIYRERGLLAPGLPDAGREQSGVNRSAIAMVIHERHFNRHDYMIWTVYGTVQPAYVLTFQGVPIVSVYLRRE
ncbi:MAG: glycosyltransferase family 39 protein [Proteobacteria bacterium]|nr:glycosyltransferase family 39 protein [Pseudomonadota bacterium]